MIQAVNKKTLVRGFTLIEVMIAVVLVAMMSLMIFASMNSSLRAKDDVEHVSQRFQDARQAMSRMAREISMAYLSKHMSFNEPPYITQFKGSKNSLFFSAFGNVVYQKDARQSDEQVLGFYLAPDKEGRQSLMRRYHPNLNKDVEKGGRSQVLCADVVALEFSYFDDRLQKWEDSWVADPSISPGVAHQFNAQGDKKDEQDKNPDNVPKPWRLPSIVKITMTVLMEEGHEMKWVSEAEIPVQVPLELE